MRPSPLLLRTAALLCLVAASCSGDGGATTTEASDTSSTLPPPEAAAAGVGADAPDDNRLDPAKPAVASSGVRPRPSGLPTTTLGTKQPNASTPAAGGTATTTTTTIPPGLPPEKCPDAKTCRRYVFGEGNTDAARALRWPTGSDGLVTVHYSVNPAHSGLSNEQVRGAVGAAFATWQAAAPKLRFVFDGFTSRTPTPGDGHNDIGWAPGSTYALPQGDENRALVEADMWFAAGVGNWTWEPCEQRDGSCTGTRVPNGGTGGCCRAELQAAATHEAGHWLWLGDMNEEGEEELDRELTMNPHPPFQDRWRSTLALGDVLGIRALYPCSCPLPPIHSP